MKKLILYYLACCTLLCVACSKDVKHSVFDITPPVPSSPITKVTLSEQQRESVQNGNNFSFALLNSMFKGDNLFLSPLSVQFALGMALNGADGETAKQIASVLGGDNAESINLYCKTLLEQLPFIDNNINLKIANALIAEETLPVLKGYKDIINGFYYTAVENMPFNQQTLGEVNSWVNNTTGGMVPTFMDNLPDGIYFLILNAIQFKAPWNKKDNLPLFDPLYTIKNGSFTLADGTVTKADYIQTTSHMPYKDAGDFTVVSIPLSNTKYSVSVLLPKIESNTAIENITGQLLHLNWSELSSSMDDTNVHLCLPKFEINANYSLKEPLNHLGILLAFDNLRADFSKMFSMDSKSSTPLFDIIQRSHINISEWGTEASSVSAGIINPPIDPGDLIVDPFIEFNANHPFVFIISENSTNIILFEGVYTGN